MEMISDSDAQRVRRGDDRGAAEQAGRELLIDEDAEAGRADHDIGPSIVGDVADRHRFDAVRSRPGRLVRDRGGEGPVGQTGEHVHAVVRVRALRAGGPWRLWSRGAKPLL